MRAYKIKKIEGWHLGRRMGRRPWHDRPAHVDAAPVLNIIPIPNDILLAYSRYANRVGYWTFGARYGIGLPLPSGVMSLTRFVDFHILKLWPKYGHWWQVVGAHAGAWEGRLVPDRTGLPTPTEDVRWPAVYNYFLRYEEDIWWGQMVWSLLLKRFVIKKGPYIGPILMFERRGRTKATKYEDEWDFGMTWFEKMRVHGKENWFLWMRAEVSYVGFALRIFR